MSEKASSNDSGSSADADPALDIPGFPSGEELSVDPNAGDEIDPLPKWWEDDVEVSGGKVQNRRIEDGIEIGAPRRKALRPIHSEEDPGIEEATRDQRPDPLEVIEAEPVREPVAKTPPPMPEIEMEDPEIVRKPDLPDIEAPGPEVTEVPDWIKDEEAGGADRKVIEPEKPEEPIEVVAPDLDLSQLKTVPPLIKREESPVEKISLVESLGETPVKPDKVTKPEPPAISMEVAPVAPVAPTDADADADAIPETAAEAPAETPVEKPVEIPAAPKSKKPEPPQDPAPAVAAPTIGDPLPLEAAMAPVAAKRKAGCWTVFATIYVIGSLFLLLLIVGAALFAGSKFNQLGADAVELAKTKLAEQGLHVDHGEWKYAFPRGIVFDEVTLYDDSSKTRPALKISDLGVNVDVLALATKGGAVESAEFSLHDSTVTLFEGGNRYAELTGAAGEVLVTEAMIEVERLSARVGGLQVRLRGEVKLPGPDAAPPAGAPAPAEAEKPALAAFDFSAFGKWQPWLAIEGIGDEVPVLEVDFSMDSKEPGLAVLDGSLSGGRLKWQTLEFGGASIAFRVDPASGTLRFPQVLLQYGNGTISGSFSIDTATQTLKVESLQSGVDLIALLSSYDPAWAEGLKSVRFVDAPILSVTGEVPLGDPTFASLDVRYTHGRGLVWLTGTRELPVSDIRGNFKYDRGALETNNAAGTLFGGRLEINGAMNLLRDEKPFTGLLELTGADLEAASKWFGQEPSGLSGRLSLVFRGTGTGELATINGGGNLRIEEANLAGFPLVGSVRERVGAVLPGLVRDTTGNLTGAYIIESGVLVTSDLTLLQGGLRMVVNGSVNLVTNSTNFVAKVDLTPEIAAATGLKDKAVTIEGGGTLSQPELKMREFPVEFASGALGEVLGSSPDSLQKLKDLVDSEEAAKVISGSLDEAAALGIDPAVTDFLKGLIGGGAEAPAPVLRAVPRN